MRCRVLAPYVAVKDNAVIHQMKVGFVVDVDDDLVDELVQQKKVVPVKAKPEPVSAQAAKIEPKSKPAS